MTVCRKGLSMFTMKLPTQALRFHNSGALWGHVKHRDSFKLEVTVTLKIKVNVGSVVDTVDVVILDRVEDYP